MTHNPQLFPTKEQLRKFYQQLRTPIARALFLGGVLQRGGRAGDERLRSKSLYLLASTDLGTRPQNASTPIAEEPLKRLQGISITVRITASEGLQILSNILCTYIFNRLPDSPEEAPHLPPVLLGSGLRKPEVNPAEVIKIR